MPLRKVCARKNGRCRICGKTVKRGDVVFKTVNRGRVKYTCLECYGKMENCKVFVSQPLMPQSIRCMLNKLKH
ncbi:MAG: hypothetical protein QXQ94_10890, partial [Candidatus Bathyarchaeia archaeon]